MRQTKVAEMFLRNREDACSNDDICVFARWRTIKGIGFLFPLPSRMVIVDFNNSKKKIWENKLTERDKFIIQLFIFQLESEEFSNSDGC